MQELQFEIRSLFIFSSFLLLEGCLKKEYERNNYCDVSESDTYQKSEGRETNLTVMDSFNDDFSEIIKTFSQTSPSAVTWSIEDGQLVYDSIYYSLIYSIEMSNWSVKDNAGQEIGTVNILANTFCGKEYRLELSTTSGEKGTASLIYN